MTLVAYAIPKDACLDSANAYVGLGRGRFLQGRAPDAGKPRPKQRDGYAVPKKILWRQGTQGENDSETLDSLTEAFVHISLKPSRLPSEFVTRGIT